MLFFFQHVGQSETNHSNFLHYNFLQTAFGKTTFLYSKLHFGTLETWKPATGHLWMSTSRNMRWTNAMLHSQKVSIIARRLEYRVVGNIVHGLRIWCCGHRYWSLHFYIILVLLLFVTILFGWWGIELFDWFINHRTKLFTVRFYFISFVASQDDWILRHPIVR